MKKEESWIEVTKEAYQEARRRRGIIFTHNPINRVLFTFIRHPVVEPFDPISDFIYYLWRPGLCKRKGDYMKRWPFLVWLYRVDTRERYTIFNPSIRQFEVRYYEKPQKGNN